MWDFDHPPHRGPACRTLRHRKHDACAMRRASRQRHRRSRPRPHHRLRAQQRSPHRSRLHDCVEGCDSLAAVDRPRQNRNRRHPQHRVRYFLPRDTRLRAGHGAALLEDSRHLHTARARSRRDARRVRCGAAHRRSRTARARRPRRAPAAHRRRPALSRPRRGMAQAHRPAVDLRPVGRPRGSGPLRPGARSTRERSYLARATPDLPISTTWPTSGRCTSPCRAPPSTPT